MNRINTVKIKMVKECSSLYDSSTITAPNDAVTIVRQYLDGTDRENFILLALNNKNKVICINTISIGHLSASIVHPREVFKSAILSNCASIIVVHNHPSGNSNPSHEDLAVTERLVKAGKILDIPVLDHIIIGDGTAEWFSFKSDGLLKGR